MATATTAAATAGAPREARGSGTLPRGVRLLVVLLVALLGLAGCGALGADGASSEGAAVDEAAQDAGALEVAPPVGPEGDDAGPGGGDGAAAGEVGVGEDSGTSPGPGAVLPGTGGAGRRVVTSTIDVAVEDVGAAAEAVRALAVLVGGEVADESSQWGERPRAEIVLRVPSGETAEVLDEVADLGEEVARTADSEPVETRLVDLESRTATQRAGVERIRELLARATTLQDVLALEAELTRRQADLESVDAQRAALADLAALATITVRLTTPEDVVVAAPELPPFLQGLDAGWKALGASTTVVLVVLGSLLPFAVVAAALGGAALTAVRAVRGRRRPTESPAA